MYMAIYTEKTNHSFIKSTEFQYSTSELSPLLRQSTHASYCANSTRALLVCPIPCFQILATTLIIPVGNTIVVQSIQSLFLTTGRWICARSSSMWPHASPNSSQMWMRNYCKCQCLQFANFPGQIALISLAFSFSLCIVECS